MIPHFFSERFINSDANGFDDYFIDVPYMNLKSILDPLTE